LHPGSLDIRTWVRYSWDSAVYGVIIMAGTSTRDNEVIDVLVPSPKRVVSVKLEVELIEEIDRVWRLLGYNSRSDFIREAILYYMQIAMRRLESSSKNIAIKESDNREEEYDELV
jgi:Arc/MetJ-type ribon-helix-helix transcriptional regulator